jgi:hypothetical protein
MTKILVLGTIALLFSQNVFALSIGVKCTYREPQTKSEQSERLEIQFPAAFNSEINAYDISPETYTKILEDCRTANAKATPTTVVGIDSPIGEIGRSIRIVVNEPASVTAAGESGSSASSSAGTTCRTPYSAELFSPSNLEIDQIVRACESGTPLEKNILELAKLKEFKEAKLNAEILKIKPTESSGTRVEYSLEDKVRLAEIESRIMQNKRQFDTDALTLIRREAQRKNLPANEKTLLVNLLQEKQLAIQADHKAYEHYLNKEAETVEFFDIMREKLTDDLTEVKKQIKESEPTSKLRKKIKELSTDLQQIKATLEIEIARLEKDRAAIVDLASIRQDILKHEKDARERAKKVQKGAKNDAKSAAELFRKILPLKLKLAATLNRILSAEVHLNRTNAIQSDIDANRALKQEREKSLFNMKPQEKIANKRFKFIESEFQKESRYFASMTKDIQEELNRLQRN